MKFEVMMDEYLLREKIIRDLRSLVLSPLILKDPLAWHLQSQMIQAVFRFLERDPLRIFRMIDPPEPRLPLGKWFERIFYAALRMTFPFAEVLHSVSDQQGGELDFIVLDGSTILHIECAVKFFLHKPEFGSGLSSYVGPGGQDRLDLKYLKMRDIQLKRRIPPHIGEGRDLKRILWMSGRIHYPMRVNSWFDSKSVLKMNPFHNRGYWGTSQDVFATLQPTEKLLRVPRQWWMTSFEGLTAKSLIEFDCVSPVEIVHEPFMTARIDINGGAVHEVDRGFIVLKDI